MKKKRARQMMSNAMAYVGDDMRESHEFQGVDCRLFRRIYLWVVYVSGFRNAVAKKQFPALMAAFHSLDLDTITTMRSIDAGRLPIRKKDRANWFLEGCKLINIEGWQPFKKRLAVNHRAVLRELPGIGPATSQHMAPRLGLEDTEKCDTWIIQFTEECDMTVNELVSYLSKMFELCRWEVDDYLWRYCRDNQELP